MTCTLTRSTATRSKSPKVEGGVNDYVAVKLNGGVNDKVNPICSCSEIVSKPEAYA
jgi:hypothetical protein